MKFRDYFSTSRINIMKEEMGFGATTSLKGILIKLLYFFPLVISW